MSLKHIVGDFVSGVEMPLVHSWYVYALFLFYCLFYVAFKYGKIDSIAGKSIIVVLF